MKRYTPVGSSMTIHETAYGELCLYSESQAEIDRLRALLREAFTTDHIGEGTKMVPPNAPDQRPASDGPLD